MKHILLSLLLLLGLSSCDFQRKNKEYSLDWIDNTLIIRMEHPTMGIVSTGLIDWHGVDLDKVIEDVYKECSNSQSSGIAIVCVRFENPITDKYGNVTMEYDEFKIASIPLSEARKFKSGKFLDAEYKLTEGILKAAFGNRDDYDQLGNSQYNGLSDTVKAGEDADMSADDDYYEWLKEQSNRLSDTVEAVDAYMSADDDYYEWLKNNMPTDTPDF